MGGAVPHFYINVLNDVSYTVDDQGVELADLDAARAHARKAIGEILADELVAGKDLIHLTLVIEGPHRQRLADLKVVTKLVASENIFPS